MDRVPVVNFLFGLLALLLLQGVIHVEGRNLFSAGKLRHHFVEGRCPTNAFLFARAGNRMFNPKDDGDIQGKILSLLLHKSSVPVEKNDPPGLELVDKLAELEELEALREGLELEKELTVNLIDKPTTRKRGEPCFWKYCV
ncbi:urotensin 2 domain containing isoform X1 [Dunckerocampus dactyliophorus]|uniref:urotensin 2 domain containing isoform X1 n=1 Tax=Dunckerocampus dactyliophorus TaxID=161453 RepID=UPI002406DE3D|nr:urotensin 2 domain containing isoform X1 [Dunckerocampus dactyliophorus]